MDRPAFSAPMPIMMPAIGLSTVTPPTVAPAAITASCPTRLTACADPMARAGIRQATSPVLFPVEVEASAENASGRRASMGSFLIFWPTRLQGDCNVMTGHDDGAITIALTEADEVERERRRLQMGEPYRTLLGHFRHEVGHYYWDILVRDGNKLDACRAVFGDDSVDYEGALARHYKEGAPLDWQQNFVSTYASDASRGKILRKPGRITFVSWTRLRWQPSLEWMCIRGSITPAGTPFICRLIRIGRSAFKPSSRRGFLVIRDEQRQSRDGTSRPLSLCPFVGDYR